MTIVAQAGLSQFGRHRASNEPAIAVAEVTPDDDTDVTASVGGQTLYARAWRFDTEGNFEFWTDGQDPDNDTPITRVVYDGETLAWACIRRVGENTTAGGIMALF